MIFDFSPWKLDVDVESTQQLYFNNNFSEDKMANARLYVDMSDEKKKFFNELGVDPLKMNFKEKTHVLPGANARNSGKIYMASVDFLVVGKLLSMPKSQKDACVSKGILREPLPIELAIADKESAGYPIEDWKCTFKHPALKYADEAFQKWDCGMVVGSILIMKDL